jgi:hypothetical protein
MNLKRDKRPVLPPSSAIPQSPSRSQSMKSREQKVSNFKPILWHCLVAIPLIGIFVLLLWLGNHKTFHAIRYEKPEIAICFAAIIIVASQLCYYTFRLLNDFFSKKETEAEIAARDAILQIERTRREKENELELLELDQKIENIQAARKASNP